MNSLTELLFFKYKVMPIAAYVEISDTWHLGSLICDIWTSFDMLCCTASILHLVGIALDRYWAITNVEYAAKRTVQRIVYMIVIIWSISTVVGISPHIFGLSASQTGQSGACRLTDNLTFQLVSTFAAFYLPLVFMCVIYWKIFQSAKFRIRKKVFNKKPTDPESKTKKFKFLSLIKTKSNGSTTVISSIKNNNDDSEKIKLNKIETFSNQSSILKVDQIDKVSENCQIKLCEKSIKGKTQNIDSQPVKLEEYTLDTEETKQITLSENNLIDTQISDLDDTLKLTNNNNKSKYRAKKFNSSKLERIKKILTKADSINRNLERVKNNELPLESLTFCLDKSINNNSNYNNNINNNSIAKITADAKITEADNPISSCENQLNNSRTNNLKTDCNHFTMNKQEDKNQIKPIAQEEKRPKNETHLKPSKIITDMASFKEQSILSDTKNTRVKTLQQRKAKIDIKRERKAARVLGIIMSCFIVCWLPFFCKQIFIAICKDCSFSILLDKYRINTILNWSGYVNSLLNPIIYTIFSPDFREAFGKILFGKYRKNRTQNRNFKR